MKKKVRLGLAIALFGLLILSACGNTEESGDMSGGKAEPIAEVDDQARDEDPGDGDELEEEYDESALGSSIVVKRGNMSISV